MCELKGLKYTFIRYFESVTFGIWNIPHTDTSMWIYYLWGADTRHKDLTGQFSGDINILYSGICIEVGMSVQGGMI